MFWEAYTDQVVSDEWDMKEVTGGAEEQAAIQSALSTCLRKEVCGLIAHQIFYHRDEIYE